MTRALLAEVGRIGARSVSRLINTHHHVDHTLGNALFPSETSILSHSRAKAEMERGGLSSLGIIARIAPHFAPELEAVAERLPDQTFEGESMSLQVGGRELRLLHFGTAHTRGDIVVYLPDQRLVFAGDLAFFEVTPLAFEGHIGNWIAACERVLALDVDVIVPGHGPVGSKNDLLRMQHYLMLVRDHARSSFDAGATVRDALEGFEKGGYSEWGEPERAGANIARLYQEFRGELDAVL